MERSYLIQRLNKPIRSPEGETLVSPFAFGGGYKNGGLSDNAISLVKDIFSFDYMGAAEFEFGAVPKALNVIAVAAEAKKLVADSFVIPANEIELIFGKGSFDDTEVYILCQGSDLEEVKERVRACFGKDHPRTKEVTDAARSVDKNNTYRKRPVGWLELNNGFFFFTDKEMWEQTCKLFGVEIENESSY